MRVALVRPLCESDFLEPCEPLGLELLAAALTAEGIPHRIFDRELDGDRVHEALRGYAPDLLVLSIMTVESMADAQRLALAQREHRPETALAAGGLLVTTCPVQAQARFPAGTHFLYGEGELSLPRLCRTLEKGNAKNPHEDAPLYPEPRQWPRAERHRLAEYIDLGAPISIRSARGCPGSCAFCATPCLPAPLNRWAGRTVAEVADEMAALCARFSPPVFNFVDDDFGPLSRIEALAEELSKRGKRAAFSLQLRSPALYAHRDLAVALQKLKENGLCRIFVGVESLSPATLDWFGKALEPGRALDALATARDKGIETHIGYILWHPLATLDSVKAEARALRERGFFSVKTAMSRLVLFPGTRLYNTLGGNSHQAVWAPMDLEMEAAYGRVEGLIAPLYKQWITGATALPRLCCLAHLSGDREPVDSLNAALERLDALAFAALMAPEEADEALIARTAVAVSLFYHSHGIGRQALRLV